MTDPIEVAKWLIKTARAIREDDIPGWGNTCEAGAEAIYALDAELLVLRAEVERLRGALYDAPIMSKYHGHHGFEDNRFISDYELWRVNARRALTTAQEDAK